MDGYELAAKLRGLPELDGTFLVSVSGHELDDARWREARFNSHLAKPVTVDALVGILNVKEPHRLSR
jgi:CheY-like chemotaxis protein